MLENERADKYYSFWQRYEFAETTGEGIMLADIN